MLLTERHIIKQSHLLFEELNTMSFLSKNLYNQALYRIRQHYFNTGTFLTYEENVKQLTKEKQIDYKALPAKVAQLVVKEVSQNFISFFRSIKSRKVTHKVSIPRYLKKSSRNLLVFTNQAVSKKELKKGYLKLSGCNNSLKILHTNLNQVRILPRNKYFIVEIIYEKEVKQYKDTGNYVGIDIGVNNLATIGGNRVNSEKIRRLTFKRNNKINDFLHKASRKLVNHLVSIGVSKVVIGHNKNWKQDINLGKVNNQNFVFIPYNKFIQMLTYKFQLEGICVIQREESYTSKCSFLDEEEICKHEKYKGVRITRGLFRSYNGQIINADLNGALNILRKEIPNVFKEYGIEVCNTPVYLSTK